MTSAGLDLENDQEGEFEPILNKLPKYQRVKISNVLNETFQQNIDDFIQQCQSLLSDSIRLSTDSVIYLYPYWLLDQNQKVTRSDFIKVSLVITTGKLLANMIMQK
jgi:hypothetical protein